MRPVTSRGTELVDWKASSIALRVDLRVLRARDSTGAVRPRSRAIGSEQALSAGRAVRLQGPQTDVRAEQAARDRGCEFEAERLKSHLKSSEKMSSSPTDPRRTRTSHQPAMLAVSHHGKGQHYESGSFEASLCSTAVLGRAAAAGLGDGLACPTATESTRTLFERDRKEVPSSASPECDASELTFEFDAAAGWEGGFC